jgi:hypothetical protein
VVSSVCLSTHTDAAKKTKQARRVNRSLLPQRAIQDPCLQRLDQFQQPISVRTPRPRRHSLQEFLHLLLSRDDAVGREAIAKQIRA